MEQDELNHCTCNEVEYEPHPCPYAEEIHDDSTTLCTCCPFCVRQCLQDI